MGVRPLNAGFHQCRLVTLIHERLKDMTSEVDGSGGKPCSTADNRFIHLHPCAISGDMPEQIVKLIERGEIRDASDNDDLSVSLRFGEMIWRRLLRMAEHYERMSLHFTLGDVRGPMMSQAAKDMRFVLSDTARDL